MSFKKHVGFPLTSFFSSLLWEEGRKIEEEEKRGRGIQGRREGDIERGREGGYREEGELEEYRRRLSEGKEEIKRVCERERERRKGVGRIQMKSE